MPRKKKSQTMQTAYGRAFMDVFRRQCQARGVEDVDAALTALGERRGTPVHLQLDSDLRRTSSDLPAFFVDYIGGRRVV